MKSESKKTAPAKKVLVIFMAIIGIIIAANAKEYFAFRSAKQQIAAEMKDPETVKFRNLTLSPTKLAICGEVNGKNGFGAYSGFIPFYVMRQSGASALGSDPENIKFIRIACGSHD